MARKDFVSITVAKPVYRKIVSYQRKEEYPSVSQALAAIVNSVVKE